MNGWDTSSIMLECFITIDNSKLDFFNDKLSLLEWLNCLNGVSDAKYDISAGNVPSETRLSLISELEKQVLLHAYSIPIGHKYSVELVSPKIECTDYSTNCYIDNYDLRYIIFR